MADAELNVASQTAPDANGVIQIVVGFVGSNGTAVVPDSGTLASATTAINNWNIWTAVTGVNFTFALQGAAGNYNVKYYAADGPFTTGNCAAWSPGTNSLGIGPSFATEQAVSPTYGGVIMSHEFGHTFGLNDTNQTFPNPPTIMNNGSSCSSPYVPTLVPNQYDAQNAATCLQQARAYYTAHNPPTGTPPAGSGSNGTYTTYTTWTVVVPSGEVNCTYTYQTATTYNSTGAVTNTFTSVIGASCGEE